MPFPVTRGCHFAGILLLFVGALYVKVKQLFEFVSKAVQSTKANLAVGSNCPVSIELIVVYLSILFYGF